MLPRKLATAVSVLRNHGIDGAAQVCLEKVGMWWRRGEPLELSKLVGGGSNHVRLDGCRFGLDDEAITPSLEYLLLTGKHEAPERQLIRRFLDPALPLVELGGALGVVSCIANAELHDPSQHVVVEANPALIPVLEANRYRNRSRFSILHRAIGYGAATLPFPVSHDVLASSAHVPGPSTVTVRTTSLATILREHGFSRCNLVCDIEGTEVELVREEAPVLATAVEVLIMEVHDRVVGAGPCSAMLQSLNDLGFEMLDKSWDTVAMRRRS
jgi:FkbM family methyltransferase